MIRRVLIGLGVAIGMHSYATAQTTTCTTNGATTRCQQAPSGGIDWTLLQPPNPGASAMQGFEAGRAAAMQRYRQQQVAPNYDNTLELARRRAVGELIAEGKCEEAKSMALRGGELALAEQVKRLCD